MPRPLSTRFLRCSPRHDACRVPILSRFEIGNSVDAEPGADDAIIN
jgi:hypothetical protein